VNLAVTEALICLELARSKGRARRDDRRVTERYDLATLTRNTMTMAHSPDTTFVIYPELTPGFAGGLVDNVAGLGIQYWKRPADRG
jgi:hypothetical protein